MSSPMSRRLVAALLIGAAAFAGALYITDAPGPGLDDDAKDYLGAAQTFVHGDGLRTPTPWWDSPGETAPLGHFPPGYPVLLSLPIALGMPPVQGARLVQAFAAGVSAFGLAWLAGAVSLTAGVMAGVLFIAAPDMLIDHARILSEPVFLAVFVVWLITLALAPRRALLNGIVGLALTLIRYAGAGIVAAAGALALVEPQPWRERLRRAVLRVAPAFLAQVAWSGYVSHEHAHVRDVGLRGTLLPALHEGWHTIRDFLAPDLAESRALWAALLAIIGLAGIALLVRGARRRDAAETLPRRVMTVGGVTAACYLAFLCVARVAADPWIPFDERLFAPLFVLAALVVPVALAAAWPRLEPMGRTLAVVMILAWLGGSLRLEAMDAADLRGDGWGYSGREFLAGGTAGWLLTPAARAPIFSNNPAAVWFVTGRPAKFLPAVSDGGRTLAAFGDTLRLRRGVVVGFKTGDPAIVDPDSLAARLHLAPIATFDDGAVWGPAGPLAASRTTP